jgi:hypothetical protein
MLSRACVRSLSLALSLSLSFSLFLSPSLPANSAAMITFREVYLTALEQLREKLYGQLVKPKEIGGRKLEGHTLVALLQSWAQKIEMPKHLREGFTMANFASELDKVEHDKLMSFANQRVCISGPTVYFARG